MRIAINADACIGCGLCVQISPHLFRMESDKAVVVDADAPEDRREEAENSRQQCPVDAIKVP